MKNQPKYKSSFSCKLNKLSHSEADKYISLAGLDKLKQLMPKEIDLEKNFDLMGVVLNAAVAGRMNANGDSITKETAIDIAKNFVWKLVDSEHERLKICGVICNYGFSKFGTNEVLTEEEASKSEEPFNMSLALLIYKTILSEDYIKQIEDSADETSEGYNSLSASWEVYFDDYDIAVGSKNVSEAELVTDEDRKADLEKYLLVNGGRGKTEDGKYIYRVIKNNEILLPAGVGLVEFPAAEVKGLAIVEPEAEVEDEDEKEETEESEGTISENIPEKSVIKNKDMKINSLKDLTDENIKQCAASDISDLLDKAIREANEKWEKEVKEKETFASETQAKYDALAKQNSELQAKFDELNQKIEAIEAEKLAKAKEEAYNTRMAEMDELYELSAEDREIIAADIKDLSDDQYQTYAKKMSVLMKEKNKKAKKEKEKMMEEEEAAKCKNKASVTTAAENTTETKKEEASTTAVADAIKNGTETTPPIPNATAGEESMADRMKKAFNFDTCVVK